LILKIISVKNGKKIGNIGSSLGRVLRENLHDIGLKKIANFLHNWGKLPQFCPCGVV
jgi:hypothetical protein